MQSYRTIGQMGQDTLIIQGSRFIGQAFPIESEDQALDMIQAIKKEHWKATHNCSAYQLGLNMEIQRAHDDGEPSGTAGVPMLEVLKKQDLTNVGLVVTRYFGGTKLGAGGLIRAYTQAAVQALEAVDLIEYRQEQQIQVSFAYPLLGKIDHYLENKQLVAFDKEFSDKVSLRLSLSDQMEDAIAKELRDLTQNQYEWKKLGQEWTPVVIRPIK